MVYAVRPGYKLPSAPGGVAASTGDEGGTGAVTSEDSLMTVEEEADGEAVTRSAALSPAAAVAPGIGGKRRRHSAQKAPAPRSRSHSRGGDRRTRRLPDREGRR
jgi:hypothetical protein